MKEKQLIFIVSQPRSGSTYIQNLLSNNNKVNTCSEPWVLLNFANQIKSSLVSASFNNKLAEQAFQEYLLKYPTLAFQSELKEFIINLYSPMAQGYNYVIDKTPRYWELLEEMLEMFPKSKFIILKRNPVDVVTSIIKTWNIKDLFELNEYRRDLLLAPKQIHAFCEKYSKNKNVYTLRYEDLNSNLANEVKKLYNWLGIAYTEEVLNTENNNKYKGKYGDPYQNATEHSDVLRKEAKNKEINTDFKEFIIGYKHYLTPEFLRAYGDYSLTKGRPSNVFNDFIAMGNNAIALNKELQYLKQSTTFKVGKVLLSPFQFVKKLFL